MNNLYKLLNVSSDMQFNNLLESLDLSVEELISLESISNNCLQSFEEKRQNILEMFSYSNENNYNIIKKQMNKSNNVRKLKESVNMNVVLELNDLIDLTYSKCNDNKSCAQGVYQIIQKSLGKNVADAYFTMVRNSVNSDNNLKFDTELVIDGKNVAESIKSIKDNIVNYLNSIETPKKEKFEESFSNIDNMDKKTLQQYVNNIDKKMKSSKSNDECNKLAKLKSQFLTKLNENMEDNTDMDLQYIYKNGDKDMIVSAEKIYRDMEDGIIDLSTAKNRLSNIVNRIELNENATYNKPTFTYTVPTYNNDYFEFKGFKIDDDTYDVDLMDGDYNYITTSLFSINGAQDNNIESYIKNNTIKPWKEIEQELIGKMILSNEEQSFDEDDYYEEQLEDDLPDYEKFANEHDFDVMSDEEFEYFTGLTPSEFAKKYPIKSKNKELDEDTVYDQSWYKVKGGKYPRKTKEGIICEEELSTLNRIAGVYDINNNSFKELGKGEEHNLTLKDYQSGQVRYGIQDTKKYGIVCYITAIDRGYAYQTMKKIKSKYKDVNIDTFNLEFRTDDGKKMFIKLDNNGHQIFENKNIEHFTSEEIHNKLMEEKQLKESYDSLINDLEDAQQILYSTNRKEKYVEIINKYLKPYNKTIADLSWTGDFIDIVGEEQTEQAVDELYNINENNNNESIKPSLFKTVAKPTEWIPAINGKVIPNAPSFGGAFGKDKAQEWLNNWLEKHGFSDYLDETCSAGTTCAGSVATVSTPIKSKKKRKLSIKEMSEFPKITQLTESENYRKYAGIFDLNKNSLFYLPKNTHHMNFISENDVFNGKVRFGVAEYKSNVIGYICSDTREHIMKVLKILKKEFNNLPISYWMVEYFEDGERVRMNIDNSGKTIYENQNHWFPSWNNIKNKIIQETQVNKLPLSTQIFIDMIKSNNNSYNVYNGDSYRFNDGYLYKNAQLVKTKNLNEMVEFILGNIELPLLEGFIPEHLDMLLEDENMDNDLTPEQRQLKQQEEKELENTLQSSNEVKVSITDKNDPKNIEMNQQLLGVDDTDEQNKKFIVKNPSNNEIKIKSSEEIELEK